MQTRNFKISEYKVQDRTLLHVVNLPPAERLFRNTLVSMTGISVDKLPQELIDLYPEILSLAKRIKKHIRDVVFSKNAMSWSGERSPSTIIGMARRGKIPSSSLGSLMNLFDTDDPGFMLLFSLFLPNSVQHKLMYNINEEISESPFEGLDPMSILVIADMAKKGSPSFAASKRRVIKELLILISTHTGAIDIVGSIVSRFTDKIGDNSEIPDIVEESTEE